MVSKSKTFHSNTNQWQYIILGMHEMRPGIFGLNSVQCCF